MDQAVHTVFNLDESAEVGQIAHAAMYAIADVIPLSNCLPGILLHLLHPETHAASPWIYAQHLDFDSVARTHDFARVLDALGPAHLRNMHQSLDPRFQFYESSIISYARNLPRDTSGGRKALLDCFPRIGQELFVSERDTLAFAIEFENLYLHCVAYLKKLGRILNSSPDRKSVV